MRIYTFPKLNIPRLPRTTGPTVRNFDCEGQIFPSGRLAVTNAVFFRAFSKNAYLDLVNYIGANYYKSQEIEDLLIHYSFASVKNICFNRYEEITWPPQFHNVGSTAGTGTTAPAVNMFGEALTDDEDPVSPSL